MVYGTNQLKYLSIGQDVHIGWVPLPGAANIPETVVSLCYYDGSFDKRYKIDIVVSQKHKTPTDEVKHRYYTAASVRLIDMYRNDRKTHHAITRRVEKWTEDICKEYKQKVLDTINNRVANPAVYAALYDSNRCSSHTYSHLQTPVQRQSSEIFTTSVSATPSMQQMNQINFDLLTLPSTGYDTIFEGVSLN